jgi:hypothetical protein
MFITPKHDTHRPEPVHALTLMSLSAGCGCGSVSVSRQATRPWPSKKRPRAPCNLQGLWLWGWGRLLPSHYDGGLFDLKGMRPASACVVVCGVERLAEPEAE